MDGQPVPGVQHKYRETCLIFPASGQTCHAYCAYCYRWPQFVDMKGQRFATDQARRFARYIATHGEITDVLLTGGDPLIMSTAKLASYIEPFLGPAFDHVRSIRIGTKALAYWPYRFLTDSDADDLLALFQRFSDAGKHVSIMAHVSHWRELEPAPVTDAVRRLRDTGATIRTQAPLVRHVNDAADVWRRMWVDSVALGCIPYYMFVERDTGPHRYFSVPLARAYDIFRTAHSQVSGLARTVRGPSMSATPGKIMVNGIANIDGERVFVLTFVQGRNPEWCGRPFFARFDPDATWLSDLRPAFGAERFFFEEDARDGRPFLLTGTRAVTVHDVSHADVDGVRAVADANRLDPLHPDPRGFLVSGYGRSDYEKFVDCAVSFICSTENGRVTGFALALPWQVLPESDGSRLAPGGMFDGLIVKQVAVVPERRRHGVGSALFAEVRRRHATVQLGATIVEQPPNAASVSFHHRHGFRRVAAEAPSGEVPGRGFYVRHPIEVAVPPGT